MGVGLAAGLVLLGAVLLGVPSGGRLTGRFARTVDDVDDLKLLIAVWRHGDRAPISSYPTDPYKDSEYLPDGPGNLVAAGKRRAYELGSYLRKRYCAFLGSERLPNTTVLRSTYMPRALDSGALVLAGLYPPAEDQKWGSGLGQIWSPVAFTSYPGDMDTLLEPDISTDCEAYYVDVLLGQHELQGEVDKLTNNGEVIKYIATHSGLDPSDTSTIASIADVLDCQTSIGLSLPNWTDTVYPQPLKAMYDVYYRAEAYTHRQKRLAAGVFLNTVKDIALAYQNGSLPEGRRFYGYSGHDTTVGPVLSALGVWDGKQPPFSSAVLFELHQTNSQLGLKVLYRNDSSVDPYELTLPGCDLICPLDKFQELYEDTFLTGEEQKTLCITGD